MTNKKNKNKNSSIPIFLLFISISFVIILILEYLDFKKGKNSFIFTKIINLSTKKPEQTIKKPVAIRTNFSSNLLNIFFDQGVQIEYFKDKTNVFHIKTSLKNTILKDTLIEQITKLSNSYNHSLNLSEVKKQDNQTLNLYQIFQKKKLTHLLLISVKSIREEIKLSKPKPKTSQCQIAFIIDDIGYASDSSIKLKNLNIPITASVIPSASFAQEESSRLKKLGIETMIHIPMQSQNNSNGHRKWDFISKNSTTAQIKAIIKKAQQILPFAKGINNHMGSLVTSNQKAITAFMKSIKGSNLFFVDSRTSQNSVAYITAKEMGINTIFRDVFLDHVQEYKSSIQEIRRLVTIAKRKGKAVGIGHPYDTTFKAIKNSLSFIRKNNVKIVNVSTILK